MDVGCTFVMDGVARTELFVLPPYNHFFFAYMYLYLLRSAS